MRATIPPAAIALFALLVAPAGCRANRPAAGDVAGRWVGGFRDGPDWVFLQVRLDRRSGALVGSYDLPVQFVSGKRLEWVESLQRQVRFEAAHGRRRWRFEGRVAGPAISGTVAGATGQTPFRLDRLARAEAGRFTGSYRLDDGRVVHVRPWVELGLDGLLFVDSTTGRMGALFPTSESTFFCGPSALVTHPVESVVSFSTPAGGTPAVAWTSRGREARGRRLPLREQEMTFTNGTVTLAGTLVLPEPAAGNPPYPAVVIAPGATSAGNRQMGRHLADFFACHGVAALVFDKRGTGASSGDWLSAGFEELAGDVLAAVKTLRARDEIVADRVGLFGSSQGGWVVSLAAARSDDVAFIISQSGPGVTPRAQERYRVEHWLRADGFAEADVRAALRLHDARDEAFRGDRGWDEVARLAEQSCTEPWYPYVGDTSGPDDPFWGFWRRIRDFDPVPALRGVRCPVLAIYGDKDTYLPVARSASVWGQALAAAGNGDVTIRVFPDADHSLLNADTGGLKEAPYKEHFAAGVLPLLRDWVLARVRPVEQ